MYQTRVKSEKSSNSKSFLTRKFVLGHQLATSLGHHLAISLGHQLAISLGHQLAVSLGHQLAISLGHQLAFQGNSPPVSPKTKT